MKSILYHMINQWTQTLSLQNEYASPVDLFLLTIINSAYLNLHDCTAAKWGLIEQ